METSQNRIVMPVPKVNVERGDEIALMHDANMKTTLVICLLKSFYDLLNLLRFSFEKAQQASLLPNLS